jgi:predicted nucleic acid-binding protein
VELSAPSLMWVEATSALHAMAWRRELTAEQAEAMRDRILAAPVRAVTGNEVALEAWRVADEFGWAKTYDAQYVALARILGCQLVTLDGRLRRGAERLGVRRRPGRDLSDSTGATPKFIGVSGRITLALECIA